MNKDQHIAYWIKSAEDDWLTVNSLFVSNRFLHSLFFGHLTLEKLLKGLWVRNNEGNFPPKSHNLVKLLYDSNINFTEDIIKQLYEFNTFQLEGRYPDYLFEMNRRCSYDFTYEIIQKMGQIRECLLKILQ
jgi:HEPN domain-containing protein